MVYAFAAAVWVTEKENFMLVLLFFMLCVVLTIAVLLCDYNHSTYLLTVYEVIK